MPEGSSVLAAVLIISSCLQPSPTTSSEVLEVGRNVIGEIYAGILVAIGLVLVKVGFLVYNQGCSY